MRAYGFVYRGVVYSHSDFYEAVLFIVEHVGRWRIGKRGQEILGRAEKRVRYDPAVEGDRELARNVLEKFVTWKIGEIL